MLEQLFGSKTRVKLLKLFLNNPQRPYYLRQLARELKSQLNAIRREVSNLEQVGIIIQKEATELKINKSKTAAKLKLPYHQKKYYTGNVNFVLFNELKALFLKSQLLFEKNLVDKIKNIANIKYLALTGNFIGKNDMATDMLLIGSVNRARLSTLIKEFEKDLSHNINYTVMSLPEFKYRKDITDRFLYGILEGKKIVILDNLHQSYGNNN